jgi:hypothetical protein
VFNVNQRAYMVCCRARGYFRAKGADGAGGRPAAAAGGPQPGGAGAPRAEGRARHPKSQAHPPDAHGSPWLPSHKSSNEICEGAIDLQPTARTVNHQPPPFPS